MGVATAAVTGTGVYSPPDYDSFMPPAVGGSYADPVFGSTIKRISNALSTPNADSGGNLDWITGEYSTMSPFNSDNSRILLVHESYFGLYDGAGAYMQDLPLEINASSEPKWSKADNKTLYYVRGNQLKSYDASSGAVKLVRTFSEYSAISGKGESDISFDGDHFVFAGDGRYVFKYQISTDSKSQVFDTGGKAFDSLYITPNNNVTITWNQSGSVRYSGIELYDGNMNFQRQVARAGGHMDVARDSDGSEVLVWTNSNDPQPICDNGIVKIRLADGQQTCLVSFDWSLAVHVSAPDNGGFAYVETYAPGDPTPLSGWKPYTNEIMQVKLDGSQVLRLTHFRSRPWNRYNWQPRVSTSRDGTRVVFNSNYNLQANLGYSAEYGDVYLMVLGDSAPTSPPPSDSDPVPPPETKLTRFEETDPAVQSTGTWHQASKASYSGGFAIRASDYGSQVQFTFTGTGVQWIGTRDKESGIARIYLDGELMATMDTYSATTQNQTVLYSVSGLSNTAHALTLVVTNREKVTKTRLRSRWIWVDAFDVTTATESTTTTTTTSPPPPTSSEPVRIEQTDPAVTYSGDSWFTNTSASSSGGSAALCMDANHRATLTFSGTAVSWLGYRDEWSGIARVYVDGVMQATIDTYASPAQAGAVLYTVAGLAGGAHTLVIEVTGTHNAASGGSWVWLDAFDVTP